MYMMILMTIIINQEWVMPLSEITFNMRVIEKQIKNCQLMIILMNLDHI